MDDRELVTRALMDTPLIVSTDIGGDPDDALALALLALTQPRLELVITADELPDGRRAKFARHLLDLLGRDDVRVVAGQILGESKYWAATGLYPNVDVAWADTHTDVAAVCGRSRTPVRYLGLGPLTDLAHALTVDAAQPVPLDLASRLRIWQMGGALNYRRPETAEHNFRLDPAAVHTVVSRAQHLSLVMSDHTFVPAIEVATDGPIYQFLAMSPQPWAQLLRQHLDQWYARFHPFSKMHDPLTMTVAIGLPFVEFEYCEFQLAPDARMSTGTGASAWLSTGAAYGPFVAWVLNTLCNGKPARQRTWEQAMDELKALAIGLDQLEARERP